MSAHPLTDQLVRIRENCTVPNWDSYGAAPVAEAALMAVHRILVTPANNGGVVVSWNGETASVTFDAEGHICGVYWETGP